MSVNNYTLNTLYNNGILDYVPYDLNAQQVAKNPYDTKGLYPDLGDSFENQNTNVETKHSTKLSPFIKGLATLGILTLTVVGIIKGGKKPPVASVDTATKTSFWSKLNPKNWFKKK